MFTETDHSTVYDTPREPIPNKAFDTEYMTEWVREVKFLESKGINCTYVRRTPDYKIKQYKYTKTPELFVALAEFYTQVNNEKTYKRLNKVMNEAVSLPFEISQQLKAVTQPFMSQAKVDPVEQHN